MMMNVPARIPVHNVLFATDFSPCSEAVFPYVCNVARKYDATLHIIHVISPEVLSIDPPLIIQARDTAERQMQEMASSEQLEGLRHNELIAEGDVTDAINKAITDEKVDLVLVGTHGRTGIRRFVLGSVAEDVVRNAKCPVLTLGPKVAADARREARFNHILFATDLKPQNPQALSYALSLANEHDAALTMFHVIPTAPVVDSDTAISILRRKLLEMVPADPNRTMQPEAVVEIGTPSELIVNAAAMRHANLIVLGAHRPAMLSTHLMDTAYKIIVGAPCPVLTVGAAYHTVAA